MDGHCPDPLPSLGVPCRCPLNPFKLTLPPTSIAIPKLPPSVPSWLAGVSFLFFFNLYIYTFNSRCDMTGFYFVCLISLFVYGSVHQQPFVCDLFVVLTHTVFLSFFFFFRVTTRSTPLPPRRAALRSSASTLQSASRSTSSKWGKRGIKEGEESCEIVRCVHVLLSFPAPFFHLFLSWGFVAMSEKKKKKAG